MAERQKVVLATRNQGKVRELAGPLGVLGIDVVGLEAFPQVGDIVEDGATFADNAYIKARAVADLTGLVSISDDSGLEVDALRGAPGVHSARYGDDWPAVGGESRDARNIRKLLAEMAGVPEDRRQGRFVCCMCAVKSGRPERGDALFALGAWEGVMLAVPRGSGGFGYDPVFWDAALGMSAAEMSREEKMRRSHRGRAVEALVQGWMAWMGR